MVKSSAWGSLPFTIYHPARPALSANHDQSIDVLITGAGVVGLSVAAELAAAGYGVALVDRHPRAGMETSTHNSGVIHAGLYYPTGSLKAQLCVEGAGRLYSFCERHGVPADRCGKLVVAAGAAEREALEALLALAKANGVAGLEIVDRRTIRAREPYVEGAAALWSPNTGRVDGSALIRALLRQATGRGAIFLPSSAVIGGEPHDSHIAVWLERETIVARTVVNAAGLYADDVSAALGGERFTIYPCRGEYAELKPSRRDWIRGLVYPLPHASGHGLGVHCSRTTDGVVLLGPTIRYQTSKDDYERDRLPLAAFVDAVRPMLPVVGPDDVTYGGSGIRAKLHPPEERFADFLIRGDRQQPCLIHAAGIDSPGLTASLAIGARVARLVKERLR